jgi:hypothetical protein
VLISYVSAILAKINLDEDKARKQKLDISKISFTPNGSSMQVILGHDDLVEYYESVFELEGKVPELNSLVRVTQTSIFTK